MSEQVKKPAPKLTAKQKIFCKEYLKDKNATQAAIRAGYSKKTAPLIGSENLKKPYLSLVIEEGLEKQAAKIELTAENVLREYQKLAFSNMKDCLVIKNGQLYADISKMTRDQLAAISEISVPYGPKAKPLKFIKLKLADKKGALDSLARHFNLFTSKTGFVPGMTLDPGGDGEKPATVEYHTHINLHVKSSDELTDLLLGRNGFGRELQTKSN